MSFEVWNCSLCFFVVSFQNRCSERCREYFCKLVEKFYDGKWISSKAADKAKKEYDSLLKSAHSQLKDIFLTFNQKEDRVDSFYASIMSVNASFKSCWEIFKIVFTLSHGQVSVERGFSINKELLVENLEEESVVCQRMVYDHVSSIGKPINQIQITSAMMKSCKLAYSRYNTALEANKNKSAQEVKDRKRKMKMEEIATVTEKEKGCRILH